MIGRSGRTTPSEHLQNTSSGPCVVHVSAHYPPLLGGTEKVVEWLARNQRMQGLEVAVLTSLDEHSPIEGQADDEFVRRLPSWEIAHTSLMPGLPRELLKLPRDSVIHLHVAQAFVPEAVYAAHRIRGLPYVAHFHLDAGPSGWAGFMLRAYKPLILGRVLRAAASVVVFTQEQRSAVASKYGVKSERIAVIPNGVDESFFCADQRALHSKPRLVFVGRLSIQKNLRLLLRALQGISEKFETTLVGEGELEANLKETARELQLKNVRFYGRADGAELRDLYLNADIFVLPSEREGMPLVLLEAMAMGLPIVATDISGSRDLVVHGENGLLVPPDDPSALRKALLSIISHQDEYQRMSEMSRWFASQYSWQTIGAELERVYAQARKH